MPISGSRDGIQIDNIRGLKVEPLMSVARLKAEYLTGLDITDPSTGEGLPDSTYQSHIDNAVAFLETFLDISITHIEEYLEHRDYRVNDYAEWGYFQLNNYPVSDISKIEFTYFRDAQGQPEVVLEIPLNWIRLQPHDGLVRLIPNARFPANLQISQSGNFFPEILRAQFVPHLWDITYSFGFEEGKIPVLINSTIARIAAMNLMMIGGNLVIGAGIASSSISIDGMSQSIQTTQSPENSAFSATIKEYSSLVFGRSKGDPFAHIRVLKDYWKGTQFSII